MNRNTVQDGVSLSRPSCGAAHIYSPVSSDPTTGVAGALSQAAAGIAYRSEIISYNTSDTESAYTPTLADRVSLDVFRGYHLLV